MDTKRLRQRVLDLAIHGKLVPQNPQDEPASELLKRIAAEKERLVKEGKIKKSKKKDNEDIDEVPFEVPQGWVWCRLGEVCKIQSSKRIHKEDYVDEGIPFYRTTEIKELSEGKDISNCLYISEEQYNSIKNRFGIPTQGDILISAVGTIGITYVIPDNSPFYFKDGNLIWIGKSNCYFSPFLSVILGFFVAEKDSVSTSGSAYNALTIEKLNTLLFPLPPLAEQHRIVSEVEKYFSLIDILEESENDLQQSIQKAKSKILDLAIKGKLVEKTGEWEEKELGDIGKWQAGATPSRANKSYYGGNIPWLKTGDLNDGFITEIPEYITEKALEETSVKLNPEGSVLVAMYGATIGKVGILTFPATTNQACCACINCSIDKMYLFYFLLANKEYFIRLGGGGAQPNISKEKIVNTPISVPPLAEQHQIVAKIEEIFTQLDNIAEALK